MSGADVATLGLAVESRQVAQANDNLRSLTREAAGAERATNQYAQGAKRAETGSQRMGREIQSANRYMTDLTRVAIRLGGALAAAFSFAAIIREAEQLETRLARMEAIIRATGGTAGRTSRELEAFARQLARNTLESVDGIMNAQQVLLTFRNVQGEVFDRAIESAADLAAAMGGDIVSSTRQLARALEDPIQGMQALTRSGTVFTQQQRDMVKEMVESGRVVEAQTFILDELASQYGGAAQAGSALAHAQDGLGQSYGELLIAINQTLRLTDGLAAVLRGLDRVVQFLSENMQILVSVVAALAATQIPALVGVIASMASGMTAATAATAALTGAVRVLGATVAIAGGPWGILAALVAGAAAYFLIFRDNTNEAETALYDAADGTTALNNALGVFYDTAAPSAAKSAIDLANDNYTLAKSAREAALAELAKARTMVEARTVRGGAAGAMAGAMDPRARAAALESEREAIERLDAAERALRQTIFERDRTVRTVTGSFGENMERSAEHTNRLKVEIEGLDVPLGRATAGAQDLSTETQDAALEMERSLQPVADLLFDLFSKPIEDMDDLLDRVTQFGLQMARANFGALFGMDSPANDNQPLDLRREIRTGAREGTMEGSFSGIFEAMGMSSGAAQSAGSGLSAGIGGFSMGYQSQSPLMGGIGGALSGAAAGLALGPIGAIGGAIVGGLAGLFGGMFGQSSARRQQRAQAGARLSEQRENIENMIDIGQGRGIGPYTETLREYHTSNLEAQNLAGQAGDGGTVARLQAAYNAMFGRLFDDFQRSFDGLAESMRAGHGMQSPFMQAANEVTDLRETLIGFVADAHEMNQQYMDLGNVPGGDWTRDRMARQIEEANEAARAMALSVLTGAEEFSNMEGSVQRAEGAAAALQNTLERLGMSADEAAQAIEDGMVEAMDNLRRELLRGVASSMADMADMGFLNDLVRAQEVYENRLRDFEILGLDAAHATAELNMRLAQIAGEAGLADEQLKMLAEAFPQLADGLLALLGGGSIAQSVADAQANMEQSRADLRSAYEAEASAIEATIGRLNRFITGLKDFRDNLRLDGQLSPLDPQQRFMEAQRQFQDVSALALTGDEEAIGKLEDVSRQYLTEARSYYATSESYFRIFQEVEGILDHVLATAGNQLSEAELQLQALKDLVSPLIDIDNSVMSVEDAIAALEAANDNYASAQAARDNEQTALLRQMLEQLRYAQFDPTIAGLYRETVGRLPEMEGHNFWLNHLDLGYTADQILALMQQSPEYLATRNIPAFAIGGMHTGGFRVVGERGPEIEATGPARYWDANQTRSFMSGNDNGDMVKELRETRQENARLTSKLIEVTAAGAQANVQATAQTTNAVKEGTDQARRERFKRVA